MSTFQVNVTVAPLNEVITIDGKEVRVQSDEVQIPIPVILSVVLAAQAPPPNPPEMVTLPVVSPSPTAIFGSTISCNPGEYTNSPTEILIQWQRNEADIPDKTGPTLDTTGMSLGDVVRAKVTASNAGGVSHEQFSNVTELVEA